MRWRTGSITSVLASGSRKMIGLVRRGAGWPPVAPHTTAEVLPRADISVGGGGWCNACSQDGSIAKAAARRA